ncbi:MAG TPA: RNA polymerase sigma-70 factor [Jiangellaceae bacterium]|nr:RNA polymerase sigma-70 factor [Jiangellaceae bacterium]
MSDLVAAYDELRPLMFSIAYRMLGSVAEAEDVVQDAFVRMHRRVRDGVEIDSPDAFATTVTTRLAIDALRSARHRREQYVGSWLPEPLIDDDADPARRIEMDETVSTAFLVVLERLSPTERAVFLLREVFGYEYTQIAAILDKSEQNCRQILTRARRSVADARPQSERQPRPRRRSELAEAFFAALRGGDLATLEQLLADDVVFYADGGGKAPAIRAPMHGPTPIARFVLGLGRLANQIDATIEQVIVNGQPGAEVRGEDGALLGVVAVEFAEDGHVRAITNQINPDKLTHLGRVGDLPDLIQRRGSVAARG